MGQYVDQMKNAWRSDEFTNSVSSFQNFCGALGMEHLPEFLSANNFIGIEDWSEPLSAEGKAMQKAVLDRSNVSCPVFVVLSSLTMWQALPLRLTKTLLGASIDKLRDDSPAFEIAAAMWADAIPVILPNLLQLIKSVRIPFNHAPY